MRTVWNLLVVLLMSMTGLCPAGAQQDPQFSQYMLNQFVYNPGYAGADNVLSATAHLRAQWMGIEGNPFIQNLSIHSPVQLLHGGAGMQLLNEEEGAMRLTSVSLGYAYIHRSRIGNLSVGISGGLIQAHLNGSALRAPDGNYDNGIDHQDPILPISASGKIAPDFSAGIFFSSSKLNMGLSATHVAPTALVLDGGGGDLSLDLIRQYYFQSSVLLRVSKSVMIRPALHLKSNGDNLQAEGDVILSFNNLLWFGGGYRGYNNSTTDAVIGMAGIMLGENLRIGYSYDYTLSALQDASNGSHEVLLNYRISLVKPAKPGKVIYNPRF